MIQLDELRRYEPGPEQQWYNEGFAARMSGVNRDANPYRDDHRALCWDEAWELAASYIELADKYEQEILEAD